jgi:hypothetical protein
MESNSATSSGSPHTLISATVGGGIVPPPPPSPFMTTNFHTPTTSGSGSIPSTTLTFVPFIQNVSGTPFSYGIPGFDSNSVLTYSNLNTIGLGVGISNAPLEGSSVGTTSLFNAIPYCGGHIPPPSPFLGGTFQQPIGPNTNYSLFSEGIERPSSYTTPVGTMSFSLFHAFGNNAFTSFTFSIGGNPIFGQQNPMQGFIPSQGAMT